MSANLQLKLGGAIKQHASLNLKAFYLQLSNKQQTFISQVIKASEERQALFQEDFHFTVQRKEDLLFKATLWEYDSMLLSEPPTYILADHQFDLALCSPLANTKRHNFTFQLKDQQQSPFIQLSLNVQILNDETSLFRSGPTPFMPPQHSSAQPLRRQVTSMPANYAPISSFTTSVPAMPMQQVQPSQPVRPIPTLQKAAASFQQLKQQPAFVRKNIQPIQTTFDGRNNRVANNQSLMHSKTMQSPVQSPMHSQGLLSPSFSRNQPKQPHIVQSARPVQKTQSYQPNHPISSFNLPMTPQSRKPQLNQFSHSTRNIQQAPGFFKRT